jgi:hypothetical protein
VDRAGIDMPVTGAGRDYAAIRFLAIDTRFRALRLARTLSIHLTISFVMYPNNATMPVNDKITAHISRLINTSHR